MKYFDISSTLEPQWGLITSQAVVKTVVGILQQLLSEKCQKNRDHSIYKFENLCRNCKTCILGVGCTSAHINFQNLRIVYSAD